MVKCNTTLEDQHIDEIPYSGSLTFHEIGLIVSAIFALIATGIALYLIFQHALHYVRPWEQKYIIRILFMIPVYSVVSFLSYVNYKHAVYFQLVRDCYEAFAIASFFTLLCHYVAPTLHDQKDFFRSQRPKNWVWPIPWFQKCSGGQDKGLLKRPRSGLTWFNVIWIGIFQYCFVRVFFTVVSVLAQATDRFCESSLNPAFAHIWVQLFEGAAVGVAMYCIIQFYAQIREDIAEHQPFLKLLSIKLVIFFCFWQNFLISFISTRFTPTKKINYPDVKVGIPSMLLTLEMAIFAVLHLWSFPWRKPYSLKNHSFNAVTAPGSGFSGTAHYKGGPLGIYAFADACNPWDIVKASARGVRWLVKGRRYRQEDASYNGVGAGARAADDPFADPREESGSGRKANGVYGAGSSSSDGQYSSAKLYPVGPEGPVSLHQGSADDIHSSDVDTSYHSSLARPQRQTHVEDGDIGGNTRLSYLAPEPAPSHLYADRGSSSDPPHDGGSGSASRGPSPSRYPDEYGDQTGLLRR